jgi:multidrug efflux pump
MLENPALTLALLLLMIALNVVIVIKIPKGFFPPQDTGVIAGGVQGPQDASFTSMNSSIRSIAAVVKGDPAVQNVIAFTGGQGATNSGNVFVALKPLAQRKGSSAFDMINRLRPQLNHLPGASCFLQAAQDLRIGGRASSAMYQYTLQSDNVNDLFKWCPASRT